MTAEPASVGESSNSHVLPSRYLEVDSMEWQPTRFPGIVQRVLLSLDDGFSTVMYRMEPGSVIPLHEHTDVEQTFVLSGSLDDDEGGSVTAGNYVSRPKGQIHVAFSPNGSEFLAIFRKPNRFI